MCALCQKIPCDSRCPNATDPLPVCTCGECGDGIYAGDRYWDSPQGLICESCLEDMAAETILAIVGEETKIAKEEQHGW